MLWTCVYKGFISYWIKAVSSNEFIWLVFFWLLFRDEFISMYQSPIRSLEKSIGWIYQNGLFIWRRGFSITIPWNIQIKMFFFWRVGRPRKCLSKSYNLVTPIIAELTITNPSSYKRIWMQIHYHEKYCLRTSQVQT